MADLNIKIKETINKNKGSYVKERPDFEVVKEGGILHYVKVGGNYHYPFLSSQIYKSNSDQRYLITYLYFV